MHTLDVILANGNVLPWQYSVAAFLSLVAAFSAIPYIDSILSKWYGQQR